MTGTEQLIRGLEKAGFTPVTLRTRKYRGFAHPSRPVTYLVGRCGALRVARTGSVTGSVSLTNSAIREQFIALGAR